ncbi:MAG: sigma-70 family RNA polymerase sigma factor [Bacteroides thetaiotaomicron]|nr:sigma-70 family RNA polymerase sigma factor [Bacteroides thetaiotaomicron]
MLFNVRNISKLSDEELLTHYIKSGDTEYFGELYNRYIPLTYGLCLKYLQDEDQAQEAVMQMFEDLLPKIINYEIKAFKPWLYRVAKNHCLQLLRKENKEIPLDYTIMSYADIVEQTGFTLNNVKSYIQNGKRNLKICIKKQAL